jgi:hypothetical protein
LTGEEGFCLGERLDSQRMKEGEDTNLGTFHYIGVTVFATVSWSFRVISQPIIKVADLFESL